MAANEPSCVKINSEGPAISRKSLAYFILGDYEKSVDCAREALRHPNTLIRADIVLVAALSQLGRQDEAEIAVANMLRRRPGLTCATAIKVWGPIITQEFKENLSAALRKTSLLES